MKLQKIIYREIFDTNNYQIIHAAAIQQDIMQPLEYFETHEELHGAVLTGLKEC